MQRKAFISAFLFFGNSGFSKAADVKGAVPCPNQPLIMGYTNTTLLNRDISTDVSDWYNGVREALYKYVLCPDTTFYISSGNEPIRPLLRDSVISCGENGSRDGNCVLSGGEYHFFGHDHENFALIGVSIKGITFEGATIASTIGNSHPNSVVSFIDCVWRNNTGKATFWNYTPAPENNRPRRLSERKTETNEIPVYDKDGHSDRSASFVNQPYFEIEEGRELATRYSMVINLENCDFENNNNEQATLLNVGGAMLLKNTTLNGNKVDKLGIFSSVLRGHAYIFSDSTFKHNNAPLGPVFVDSLSYLQYSVDNFGENNTGHDCAGIFMESEGSTCTLEGTSCIGDCCDFGDMSCDEHTVAPNTTPSPTRGATATPSTIPTTSPTQNPTLDDSDLDVPESAVPTPFSKANSDPTFNPTFNPTPYPTSHPTENPTPTKFMDVLLDGLVENHQANMEDEEDDKRKEIMRILIIVLPTCLAMVIFVLSLSLLRKIYRRRELAAGTQSAEQLEASANVAETLNPVT